MATKNVSDANSTGGYGASKPAPKAAPKVDPIQQPIIDAVAKAIKGVTNVASTTQPGGGRGTVSDANSTGGYGPGTPTPPSSAGSGGGDNNGGGGSGGPTINWDGVDFSSYLNIWGLPADVQARVLQIFQNAGDPTVAAQLALGYIRTTDWYAHTYPGIQVAEAKGLVNNEADYRALLNQQTQIYKQYLGRDVTSDEFAANLTEGVSNTVVGQRLQGAVYAKTYGGDWNLALGAFGDTGQASQADLTTLGQEKAGLDTPMGQLLQRRLDQAQQRLAGVFQGSLATPALGLSGGRLAGPQANQPPDIAA